MIKMNNKATTVIFHNDGTTTTFKDQQQIEEPERSWICFYFDFLIEQGIDLTDVQFKMPNGHIVKGSKEENGDYVWSTECEPFVYKLEVE